MLDRATYGIVLNVMNGPGCELGMIHDIPEIQPAAGIETLAENVHLDLSKLLYEACIGGRVDEVKRILNV